MSYRIRANTTQLFYKILSKSAKEYRQLSEIGYIVGAIGFCLPLIIFKPTRDRYTWSPENMRDYLNRHSPAIDTEVLDSTDFEVLTTKSK